MEEKLFTTPWTRMQMRFVHLDLPDRHKDSPRKQKVGLTVKLHSPTPPCSIFVSPRYTAQFTPGYTKQPKLDGNMNRFLSE